MICKITQGSGFGGAVNYVMGKDEAELLDSNGVRSYDKLLVTKDFEMISKQNERVKRPVLNISVSFHKNDKEKITNEKMKAIAKKILTGMGFANAQYIVVRHHDAGHPHFHIVTSRVDMDLKTISDKHNFLRLNNIRKAIENTYPELTSANGKNVSQSNPLKLKGKDAVKYKIYNAIKIEIQKSINIETLIKNLEKNHAIITELKYRRGSINVVDGIKFHSDNTWLSGSKIDKNCSYLNLLKQIEGNKLETKIGLQETKPNRAENKIDAAANLVKNIIQQNETHNGVKKKRSWAEDDNELER
ncbi:MAG: relaxase/mobilization nuclease domain-containing protein [Ferruginibacter sp.]|nr:relaxase/mobilization nuclease domain-containing protein [Ferruginibacter sp.]